MSLTEKEVNGACPASVYTEIEIDIVVEVPAPFVLPRYDAYQEPSYHF